MDNQPQNTVDEPKSFGLYKGKAPIVLQILAGLMWLGGLGMILQGIPMLLVLGLGIIPIALGYFNIKYARAIFRMEKKAYKGTLILEAVLALLFIGLLIGGVLKPGSSFYFGIGYPVVISLALYAYRQKFVN